MTTKLSNLEKLDHHETTSGLSRSDVVSVASDSVVIGHLCKVNTPRNQSVLFALKAVCSWGYISMMNSKSG